MPHSSDAENDITGLTGNLSPVTPRLNLLVGLLVRSSCQTETKECYSANKLNLKTTGMSKSDMLSTQPHQRHLCFAAAGTFLPCKTFKYLSFIGVQRTHCLVRAIKCHACGVLKITTFKWLKALRNTGRPMKGHTPTFTLCSWTTGVKVHCV